MRKINNKKVWLTAGLAASFVLFGAGLATVDTVDTSANTTVTAENAALVMDKGAGVRLGTADGNNGIRFALTMDKAQYDALMEKVGTAEDDVYSDISFGMIITKASYVSDEKDLTVENLFDLNASDDVDNTKFQWKPEDSDGNWTVAAGKSLVVNQTFGYLGTATDYEDDYVGFASLVEIQDYNLTQEFIGRGYMKYTAKDGTVNYRMADYFDGTRANNVRSMTYVAQKAIEDPEMSAHVDTLKALYITHAAVAAQEATVTVNHHKVDVHGKETVETETLTEFKIGETATAEALTDEAWVYDETRSTASGLVYANGKTVLDLYYDQDPKTVYDLWHVGTTAAYEQVVKLDETVTGGLRYDRLSIELSLDLVEGTMPRLKFYALRASDSTQLTDPAENGWITVANGYNEATDTYTFTTTFAWAHNDWTVGSLFLVVEDGSYKLGIDVVGAKIDAYDLRYDDEKATYQTRNFQWQNPTITGKHYKEYVKISFEVPKVVGTVSSIQFLLYNSLTTLNDSTVRTNSSQKVYDVNGNELKKETNVLMSNFDLTASKKIEMVTLFPWGNDDHTVYTLQLVFRGESGFMVMVDNIQVELVPDFVPAA